MLPKFATHIFHHTSRVAAAVPTQTTQAIRNAWQYQQSTPSGTSGGAGGAGGGGGGISQWGGVGSSSGSGGHSSAGPGGAKYNAGSRFYSGATGPGRSITQANPTSAQLDDYDERTLHPVAIKTAPAPVPSRPRSSSLSLSTQGRIDRGEELGVLKAVQMRARHAFAAHHSTALANGPPVSIEGMDLLTLVRHNSTSTHSDISVDIDAVMSPPPSILEGSASSQSSIESDVVDPASPQSATEPIVGDDVVAYDRLRKAGQNGDIPKLLEEISRYRAQSRVSVPCYNMAMQALHDNRAPGQPISFILELYNEMLERNLVPNLRTYKTMILALCARDADVNRVIASLENRMSRRDFAVRTTDEDLNSLDKQRVAQLKTESNFTSALTLFQAATLVRNQSLGLPEYNALIRSCGLHRNVQAALRVFAHMEKFPEEPPSPVTYALLLSVFCNTNDLGGAKQVFHDFKEASTRGRLAWDWTPRFQHGAPPKQTGERNELSRHSQIQVWNKMIDTYFRCGEPAAALDLFESMLDTPRGQDFGEADAPLPNSITYTSIITGFCEAGDVQSALSWFDRLITQQGAAENPYAPLSTPPRPDHLAWIVMIDTLARTGNVNDLNRLFLKLMEFAHEDRLPVRIIDRHAIFRANLNAIEALDIEPSRATGLLDFVLTHVLNFDNDDLTLGVSATKNMLVGVVRVLKARGDYERALDLVESSVLKESKLIRQNEADGSAHAQQTLYQYRGLRNLVQTLSATLLFPSEGSTSTPQLIPVKHALRMAALCQEMGIEPHGTSAPWYIYSYMEAKRLDQPRDLSLRDWELLFKSFVPLELPPMDPDSSQPLMDIPPPPNFVSPGLASVLRDFAQTNFDLNDIDLKTVRKVMRALYFTHGQEESARIIHELGPRFAFLLELRGVDGARFGSGLQIGDHIPAQDPSSGKVHVDLYHSRFVEEWFPNNPEVSAHTAFERFESGVEKGIYPSPECIGRLIGALGRLGEVDKVHTLYAAGQRVLAALEDQKRWQSAGWFVIEDQMVIAFAHAGEYDAAHIHRLRILDQGGTPSADAYGALISSLKETTDDTAHALQLWEEALARDVRPNIFMYNTIISKLAKARKADHALRIFQQMKEQGIRPSSVTYGALIAACCRVGDATSAELFFHEMSTSKNFKPRVPPYNTMIQLYTYTKPDRERVLYYYNALLDAGINPSPHTYKLLLDAYGTIQPVDTAAMEQIFQRITESPRAEVQGTHWAALINAYGCAGKDLDRAIDIFESIKKHPSTARGSTSLPDAVVYEALFNVFSAHRRPDLIQIYLQRLQASHIHPTAYVANAAIKGYAAAGDLDSARAMFESLEDPPMGVAAPHNHIPHEPQRSPNEVLPQVPIYREPSTWETMVRAELGVNERERALDLIRRMDSRGYPSAVVQRVRDIMHTDTIGESPTLSSSTSPISSN